MANYKERRAEIWMLQVRTKGTSTAWCSTSRGYFHSKKSVVEYIKTDVAERNHEYYEYRPMRYIPVDLR